MSARDQLERVLYVLAEAARAGGVRIDDLARTLDVSASTVLADIEEATARVYYQPAGAVEAFDLTVDGDVVRVYSASEFRRPVRLNAAEALALGLGLRVLAAEADAQRRAEILALAKRLEEELTVPSAEAQPVEVTFGEDDYRGIITEAIEHRVYCNMSYLKAGASQPEERRVAPLRLLYMNGHWYMSAVDRPDGVPHVYRLDRLLALEPTPDTCEYSGSAEAAEKPFTTERGTSVTVRYSPRVARWLAERQGVQCDADGTLVLTHHVVDRNWLVRHVLQYAGEAVVETADARALVADAAREIA